MRGSLLDRLADATARRPSGPVGRALFRDRRAGRAYLRMTLERLRLRPDDALLEIGPGGGAFLELALGTVSRAAAIDHSPDMVALAGARNRRAVEEGRLEIVEGSAERLPWPDGSFTCGSCTHMFFFVEDQPGLLCEIRRVLRPGGRFVVSSMPRLLLTRIVCAPWRLRLRTDAEMRAMAAACGFRRVDVWSPRIDIQMCYLEP